MDKQQRYSPSVFWSPMSVATTSCDTEYVPVRKIERAASSTTVSRNHNYRTSRFLALYEVLKSLAKLPEDDSFHLAPHVCDKAADFVGLIATNLTIDAPLFFPQDGEAAVFTWDNGTVKRLLTVDSEDVDILDVNKNTFVKCSHSTPADDSNKYAFALAELAKYSTSSNSSTEHDV
jgi:hypothetical protein